ncbi:monovalent cation/H(+) antiporter subunit G [Allopusillimonas ginsengisoli]|uniref:monovalent cation/H(+) antiporter subunit G n=1 Tax=Allopusillimonas ginsengisoli TaxID=453575 RepID=UPI0010C1D9A0|nr:cation:proton antiporter [Allopusillimonas ginsengisoli]
MIETLVSIVVALLLVVSGLLTLIGCAGLLRLRTFFSRVHAPTLGNTLGVFAILLATILYVFASDNRLIVHPILITVFLVITSPVTSILLVRAAILRKPEEVATQKQPRVNASSAQPVDQGEHSPVEGQPQPPSPITTATSASDQAIPKD